MILNVMDGWTLVQVLGRGAFGEVRMIVNKRTQDPVALKVMDTSKSDWEDRACIKREICIHKALRHANIVRFYCHRSEGPTEYLFLEYCSGGELFDRIQPCVGLEEPQAHRYFVQLVAAVEYLHRRGVAHRDIKPENILLDEKDNLKLADFGLAEEFRYDDGSEHLLSRRYGTLRYMAPEVLVQTEFRAQPTDLWSCGVVLTIMLTGLMPWDEPSETSREYLDWLKKKIYLDPWNRIHPTPLSLLRKLLLHSPEGRISIPDMKSHLWFTQSQRAGENLHSLQSARQHNTPRTSCEV